MKKVISGLLVAILTTGVQAGGTVSVTCGKAPVGVHNNGELPMVNVSYTTGGDAGLPGQLWLGVLTPDQDKGAVLASHEWTAYLGGDLLPHASYEGGLPRVITLSVPFPSNGRFDTSGFIGYRIHVGHGAYTKQAQQAVASRRSTIGASSHETNDGQIATLIQRNMVENKKFGALLTVPYIDCALRN